MRTLPSCPWDAVFDRSGTLLGENARVATNNTIDDVSINSIKIIAKLADLVLSYAEPIEEILNYLDALLHGHT